MGFQNARVSFLVVLSTFDLLLEEAKRRAFQTPIWRGRSMMKKRTGFSAVEILIVIGLVGILAFVVLMNSGVSRRAAKEQLLRSNLSLVRQALDVYRSDHGHYPCTLEDWNKQGYFSVFERQMTEYTDAAGQPSKVRTEHHKFGPYLKSWPVEPFSESSATVVDIVNNRLLQKMSYAVATSEANSGWYYEAQSGNFCANLGQGFPPEYARY